MDYKVKLIGRYVLLVFIMYLADNVTSAEYLLQIKEIKDSTLNVIVLAVFAALTLVVKFHMGTKIDKD